MILLLNLKNKKRKNQINSLFRSRNQMNLFTKYHNQNFDFAAVFFFFFFCFRNLSGMQRICFRPYLNT